MAVRWDRTGNGTTWLCKSTEIKPTTGIPDGTVYFEADTGDTYVFYDGEWFRI